MRFQELLNLIGAAVLLPAFGCESDGAMGAGDVHANVEDKTIVCAATDGGAGGPGGTLFVGVPSGAPQVDAARLVGPCPASRGGIAGTPRVGPEAVDGPDGEACERDGVKFEFNFDDANAVPLDGEIVITAADALVSVPDLTDPPTIAVQRLVIRAGASLGLSCDTRIVAEEVIIEEGARLVGASRNESGCTWSIAAGAAQPGQAGVAMLIKARSVRIDGTIDLGGAAGTSGQPGGAGGSLTILTESLDVGPRGEVLLDGGAGGDGVDESPC